MTAIVERISTDGSMKSGPDLEPHDLDGSTLLVLFGDQLDRRAAALDDLDPDRDAILMVEVAEESAHVPSHRQRTILFLSAMRHFAAELRDRGFTVHYVELEDESNTGSFAGEIERAVKRVKPGKLRAIHPGEWRVLEMLRDLPERLNAPLEILEDDHFLISPREFKEWADGRKELILEHFYRMMRKRLDVLMTKDGKPAGGDWNFDKQNREPYKGDPGDLPHPHRFLPDEIVRSVTDAVDRALPAQPGNRDEPMRWPVTHEQARTALRDFIRNRLPSFGAYQDAMTAGAPWMHHSLLSSSLNLKLLRPRECIAAAVKAHQDGEAPINAVEGFVRQILGWREFIRGVYWREGPSYRDGNALDQHGALPAMYWTGETGMRCMREAIGQVATHGYGHHIQRLMVTGNFALIAGVHPREISDWYLGMYVDAVEWATLPNTLGMAMHGDGGVVGTKPYAASGQYINRMSDYCKSCRYNPAKRIGEDACPFSTFYWDFMLRNESSFRDNRRMQLALKNLERLDDEERSAIRSRARSLRSGFGVGPISRSGRRKAEQHSTS